MVRDATRVDHLDLLRTTPLCCIDGRATHPVIGSPGGTAGELIRVLTAVEQRTGEPLPDAAADRLVGALLDRWGPLYLHTDHDAAVRWLSSAAVTVSPDGAAAVLDHPPEALQQALLATAHQPEHIGCGHLRLLVTDPGSQVRPELVGAVLRAFFRAHWRGRGHTVFDVLIGPHEEAEVHVVHSHAPDRAWGQAPAVVPCAPSPRFVYHPDAARWIRRQLARLAIDAGLFDDEPSLQATVEVLAQRHLAQTLGALADGLPVRVDNTGRASM